MHAVVVDFDAIFLTRKRRGGFFTFTLTCLPFSVYIFTLISNITKTYILLYFACSTRVFNFYSTCVVAAETIERMLRNLPAKRISRRIVQFDDVESKNPTRNNVRNYSSKL